ncbi:TPA: hypothetical protein QA962_003508 [Shigella flexneri]|nr:hypothetical protein [Shigella flexneri]
MTTIKDAFQFGIEPVRITDTDNIQVNEGLPTNADPQVYALQLAKTVKAMLNGVLKDAQENIPFPVEVLPTRNSLPTPIIAHTLADRSVVVPVRGGKRPEVVTVPSGQEIVVEPIEQAILISEQTKLWDAKSSTGFTQGTLQQDAMNICENVVRTINARMVDVLESSKLLKTVELPVLTGSLTAKADAIMDALYENTESSFGSEVSDYGIIAHESQLKALSRLAAKQGFSGEDKGVFMLAKRFTALSFGCFRHDGENITVVLSRDGDSQSHDLEILGKVFVVAEAATTIKMGTGSATAVLPVVKRLKFTKTEA